MRQRVATLLPGALLGMAALLGWGVRSPGTLGEARLDAAAQEGKIELLFTYGSEKEEWVKDVTKAFNAKALKVNGKVIEVNAVPLGSGECIDEVLDPKKPRRKAHLTSPASGAYVRLGHAWSQRAKNGDLLGPTTKLVRSPVVIAMWKPMAEAMGWPRKQLGWKDILDLVKAKEGWGKYKQPDWGRFKFGHTHPQYSNSGLISVLAEVYAAAGKTEDLTVADVAKAGAYLEELERGVVHYGSSTGFFGKKMFANNPQYLNAAVLYENMVVESYLPPNKGKLAEDLVAIYPKEGTFWSDHPVAVVKRPWVTKDHRAAARVYVDFLMADEQQKKAVKYGFRPGKEKIPLAAPLDRKHGVDPENEPKSILEVPSAEVMEKVLELWKKHKKRSRIVMVVDISGSMNDDQKLLSCKRGALQFLSLLGERDTLSLLVFNSAIAWKEHDVAMDARGKATVQKRIKALLASGETALYDAVAQAYDSLQKKPDPGRISAVVVLTDGEDNKSKLTLKELKKKIAFDSEKRPTRIFTICYGSNRAKPDKEELRLRKVLKEIAEATRAKDYLGDPRNIRKVFVDIATFF